jgi:peptide/nickel transport system permease protein
MSARGSGFAVLCALVLVVAAAPVLSPNNPWQQFPGYAYAPPMPPRLFHHGELRAPFFYPVIVVDRLQRRYIEDREHPQPIGILGVNGLPRRDAGTPWLVLGGDPLGRDVLARLLSGGRLSLGVAAVAVILTLLLGSLAGASAGFAGGRLDRLIMAAADFVIVLPMTYAILTLRAAMPLVLSTSTIFWTMVVVMALATWPLPARSVRAIIAAERRKGYAEAAYAVGGNPLRILLRHLLPAAAGHIGIQGLLLFPAYIFAEATLSFVGLGFAEPAASWGVMLQDAGRVSAITEAPWLLAPAAAIVITVLVVHTATTREHLLPPP